MTNMSPDINTSSATSQDPYADYAQMNARTVSEWYDRVASSVEKCPFCDLKEKYLIYERNNVVLTVNLFPYIDGHLMVIPKRHIEKLSELTHDEWLVIKELVDAGVRVLKAEFNYDNINVLYREGNKESGSSLKHLHVHILPITPDFLHYEKTHFTWTFQTIKFPPRIVAENLKKHI